MRGSSSINRNEFLKVKSPRFSLVFLLPLLATKDWGVRISEIETTLKTWRGMKTVAIFPFQLHFLPKETRPSTPLSHLWLLCGVFGPPVLFLPTRPVWGPLPLRLQVMNDEWGQPQGSMKNRLSYNWELNIQLLYQTCYKVLKCHKVAGSKHIVYKIIDYELLRAEMPSLTRLPARATHSGNVCWGWVSWGEGLRIPSSRVGWATERGEMQWEDNTK